MEWLYVLIGSVIGMVIYVLLILFIFYKQEDSNPPPQRPELPKNETPIPSIIYKTGPTDSKYLDTTLLNLFQQTETDNPGYKIEYYDDVRARQFIENNMDREVLQTYDSLKPGAYKADLFRYCVLYVNGGIYGDLTQKYLVPIDSLVDRERDRLVIVRDLFDVLCWKNGIQISFMAAVPGLDIFRKAIDEIVYNVTHKNYGRSCLDVTGPSLFRRCLDRSNVEYRLEAEQTHHGTLRDIKTKENVIVTKMKNHDSIINKNDSTDYNVLWRKGKVFNP